MNVKARAGHATTCQGVLAAPAPPVKQTHNAQRAAMALKQRLPSTSTRGSRSRAPSFPSGRNPCVSKASKRDPGVVDFHVISPVLLQFRSRAPPRAAPRSGGAARPFFLSDPASARPLSRRAPALAGGLGATAPRVRGGMGADARTHEAANIHTDAPGADTARQQGWGISHRWPPVRARRVPRPAEA